MGVSMLSAQQASTELSSLLRCLRRTSPGCVRLSPSGITCGHACGHTHMCVQTQRTFWSSTARPWRAPTCLTTCTTGSTWFLAPSKGDEQQVGARSCRLGFWGWKKHLVQHGLLGVGLLHSFLENPTTCTYVGTSCLALLRFALAKGFCIMPRAKQLPLTSSTLCAEAADNVFFHLTYEGAVDVSKVSAGAPCTCVPLAHVCPLHMCTPCTCVPLAHVYPLHMCAPCTCVPLAHVYPLHMCTPCTCVPLAHVYPLHICASVFTDPVFL